MAIIQKMIQRNTLSKIIEIYITTLATDKPLAGLINTNIVIKAFYEGKAGAFTTLNPVVSPSNDTYLSNGFKEIDNTNLVGIYQYGIPDAILASSEKILFLKVQISTAAVGDIVYQINLTDLDNVKLGLNALDTPIVVNEANLPNCTFLSAIQLLMASLAGNTVGAGTPIIEFKRAGAEQTDLGATIIKATMDNNGDRSEIEFF